MYIVNTYCLLNNDTNYVCSRTTNSFEFFLHWSYIMLRRFKTTNTQLKMRQNILIWTHFLCSHLCLIDVPSILLTCFRWNNFWKATINWFLSNSFLSNDSLHIRSRICFKTLKTWRFSEKMTNVTINCLPNFRINILTFIFSLSCKTHVLLALLK